MAIASDTINRIIAILFALADLAERASAAPRPILWLVLWILRPAYAIAWDFVVGDALAEQPFASPLARAPPVIGPVIGPVTGGARAQARHLAAAFRVLAAQLENPPAAPGGLWRALEIAERRLGELMSGAATGLEAATPLRDFYDRLAPARAPTPVAPEWFDSSRRDSPRLDSS